MLMISMANARRNDVQATRSVAVEVASELRVNSRSILSGEITMTIRGAWALAAAGLSLANAALAHHGFGNFDTKSEVAFEGTITGTDLVNPHAYVYFDVVGADGVKTAHRCEMRAATVLRRSGWSAEMFKAGEVVKFSGAPDRFDAKSSYINTVVFSDGTSADRYAQLTKPAAPATLAAARLGRLSSAEPNLNGDWAPEQMIMTD